MKRIAIAAALGLASTLSMAQDATDGPWARPGTPSQGEANSTSGAAQARSDSSAYWQQHAQSGYMTREDTLNYASGSTQAGGAGAASSSTIDYARIDTDHDGRTSQAEWMAWQRERGATPNSGSPKNEGQVSRERRNEPGSAGRSNDTGR